MRPRYRTITPAVVRAAATDHLTAAVAWRPTRSASVDDLVRFLLLMATGLTSVFDVVRRRFPFSHDAGRRAVYASCPSLGVVAGGLNRAPHGVLELSRPDRRRRRAVTVDTHPVPYYGRRTRDVVGGPRKAGTKHSSATPLPP